MPISAGTEAALHRAADELGQSPDVSLNTVVASDYSPAASVAKEPRTRIEIVSPSTDLLQQLLADFDGHLEDIGADFDRSVVVDALAAYLSSQFVLLAGPSGTGKSTLARSLASFFCHEDSRAIVEARRQLIGPEEIVGYVSPLVEGVFFKAKDFDAISRLARPGGGSPALIVEELNLSPAEGYLAPYIHGLSGVASPAVTWQLHHADILDPPSVFRIAPYPRLLGTINVDATAHAPAPKVTARASVVLLEAMASPDITAAIAGAGTPSVVTSHYEAKGAHLAGSPRAALDAGLSDRRTLEQALQGLADRMTLDKQGPGAISFSPSRRQLEQMALYASWFIPLAQASGARRGSVTPQEGDLYRIAVENAALHHLLPSIPGRDLGRVLDHLSDAGLLPAADHRDHLGPLLSDRVERLRAAAAGTVIGGQVLDFWERLS